MRKMNRGFTLVELLAVIVILAIIMIIATMNVGKVITRSRTQSFENNMDLAVKNAKRILDTGDTLTTEKLRQSLGYSANEYDFDVAKVSDGYVLRLISNSTGKFKNVDFDTINCDSNDYICTENANGVQGKNIIGLKISTDGNIENITGGSTEDEIVKDTITNGCTGVNNNDINKYDVGYEISFCNDTVYYNKDKNKNVRGKSEDFYVINSDSETVTMIAKRNLITSKASSNSIKDTFGIVQAAGSDFYSYPSISEFDNDTTKYVSPYGYLGYWAEDKDNIKEGYESYPADVYKGNKIIKKEVVSYVDYLKKSFNKSSINGRLITLEDLKKLGFKEDGQNWKISSNDKHDWFHNSNYWTSIAKNYYQVYFISSNETLSLGEYWYDGSYLSIGVRPVITISKSEL